MMSLRELINRAISDMIPIAPVMTSTGAVRMSRQCACCGGHDAERGAVKPSIESVVHRDGCALMSAMTPLALIGRYDGRWSYVDITSSAYGSLLGLNHLVEIDQMEIINLLRSNEADSVTIFCNNPEGPPNDAVVCNGGWTNFKDRRFEGESLLEALSSAKVAYLRKKESSDD